MSIINSVADKVVDYFVNFDLPPILDFGRKKHKFREYGSTKIKKDKEKTRKLNKISRKSRKVNR